MREWVKRAFSENGEPSSSRLIMGFSTLCACGWVTYLLIHNHALPDALTMGGLTAFTTAAFGIAKFNQK